MWGSHNCLPGIGFIRAQVDEGTRDLHVSQLGWGHTPGAQSSEK